MTGSRRAGAAGVAVAMAAAGAVGWAVAGGGDRTEDPAVTSPVPGGEAGGEADGEPGAEDESEAAHFLQRMRLAFTGIVADIPELSRRADEIETASRPAPEIAADLQTSRRRAEGVRDLVAASAGLDGEPLGKELFLRAALLYGEGVRALQVAVSAEAGGEALRREHVVRARRLKILSDRVFDRATAAADPDLATGAGGVQLPDAVPDWAVEGLAVAPMTASPAAGPPAPGEAGERPSQPVDRWVSDMAPIAATVAESAAGFPALAATPDPEAARAAAARLDGVLRSARAVPDPEGGREPFALLRLAMLVDLEAALAFAAPPGDHAGRLARHLALLGEDLWTLAAARIGSLPGLPGFPAHPRSGFDRSGLQPAPVPGLTGGS